MLEQLGFHLGRKAEAIDALTRAATHLEEMELSRDAAQAWFDLAELLGETGPANEAEGTRMSAYRRALTCVGL